MDIYRIQAPTTMTRGSADPGSGIAARKPDAGLVGHAGDMNGMHLADPVAPDGIWPRTAAVKPSPREIREIATRLSNLMEIDDDSDGAAFCGDFRPVRLADLRTMASWPMTIGDDNLPLSVYFDLGSIDDFDPVYPVTRSEIVQMLDRLDVLAYRGPRDAGDWLAEDASLLSRSRPVIKQPLPYV